MDLDVLWQKQFDYYNIQRGEEKKFAVSKVDPELVIQQLSFIMDMLKKHGYTLTHICLRDFVLIKGNLFLKKDTHVVKLDRESFDYTPIAKNGIEFPSKMLTEGRVPISASYASVGLFVYYMYLRKVKTVLIDSDYGHLTGSKPYYFIKNTMEKNPCLIYL
jgi:hypothetical protein